MESSSNMKIFKAIADFVQDPDFLENMQEFYMKSYMEFDEQDENKLEYTQIHTDFVKILDEIIDSKVKSQFDSESVTAFMDTFKDSQAEYKAANENAYDILFGFVDFDTFKKNMMDFKKNTTEEQRLGKAPAAEGNESLLTGMTQAVFMSLLNEDLEDKKIGWKRMINQPEKKGVSMVICERMHENKMKLVRSDSKLKGCTIFQYECFMKDMNNWANDKSIKECKMIEQTGNKMVIYMEMNMPLMTNRTALLNIDISRLENDTQILMMSQSIERDDYPQVKGKIRMHMLSAALVRMEGDYLHQTEFTQMNMKGYIPAKLMNMVMSGMQKGAVEDLYKKLLKMPKE